MHRNRDVFCAESDEPRQRILSRAFTPSVQTPDVPTPAPKEWDWQVEHDDRKRERAQDSLLHDAMPFLVDRSVLKDVVKERMNRDVVRIMFLSSGTFHKAYLITLSDKQELVARVARRFMPRLKTESEVATMQFLRETTTIPVPQVYHYDANPYNRLGGEYILMSKASGIPLAKVYYSMPHQQLIKLLRNLASIIIPLFAYRFTLLGSLYSTPPSDQLTNVATPRVPSSGSLSSVMTPKASYQSSAGFPFGHMSRTSSFAGPSFESYCTRHSIGPIISWPFFGSNRGDLKHPDEINRGPWATSERYFASCAEREAAAVIRENEGKAAPHRLHLDPDEIRSSYHHQLKAAPGDTSDDSDEYDLEESEDEWEGPGDAMYRDYRRMQRSTFLIAHMSEREERVRKEMKRWKSLMERLVKLTVPPGASYSDKEEFGLDCHDLSLENIFVDEKDHSHITCVIDWESTTTRPLWACAHLPAFLQSSPFASNLFREAVKHLATTLASKFTPSISEEQQNGTSEPACSVSHDLATVCQEWLYYEAAGVRLRMAHRFVEWDGWEEGLIDTILGSEEQEQEWIADLQSKIVTPHVNGILHEATGPPEALQDVLKPSLSRSVAAAKAAPLLRGPAAVPLPSSLAFAKEKEKEQMLQTTGDICGGRGGELGRRLEAWLIDTDGGHKVRRHSVHSDGGDGDDEQDESGDVSDDEGSN